jgi:hypothetical protein
MIVGSYHPLQLADLAIQGRPGPDRALIIKGSLRWLGAEPAFLIAVEGTLLFRDQVLTEVIRPRQVNWHGENYAFLRSGIEPAAEFVAPLSPEAIHFVEDQRGDTDPHMKLELRYQWQEVLFRPNAEPDASDEQPIIAYGGRVFWNGTEIFVPIARSDWLQHLGAMGWSETEVFEVSVLPLREDPNLAEALRLIRDARTALRLGDYKGVLVKCREALESAARYESQGDTQKGFELLLARAFPEHEGKRKTLDPLIRALSEYAHTLGRHAQYPALHVRREEAKFAYTTTVGLFSLMSGRLSTNRTR